MDDNLRIGYIYQMVAKNTNRSFVGYTTNPKSCKYKHKMNVFNGVSSKLYDHIRNNGGWAEVNFRILSETSFSNIQELKNDYYATVEKLKPDLNEDNKPEFLASKIKVELSSDICVHDKIVNKCHICKWTLQCRHNLTMGNCNICTNEKKLCEHNKYHRNCTTCNKTKVCIHDKFKYRCFYCKD
jgi:hypothetical protein